MAESPPSSKGWVGLRLTLALSAGVLLMSATVIAVMGPGEDGVRMLIRATARSSVLFFGLAFAARPLRQWWRSDLSKALLRQRRYVGLAAAASHAVHGTAILWLILGFPAAYAVDTTTLVGGGLGFAFFAVMAVTSNDASVALLGRARWRLLHQVGGWYLWIIFTLTFIPEPWVQLDLRTRHRLARRHRRPPPLPKNRNLPLTEGGRWFRSLVVPRGLELNF